MSRAAPNSDLKQQEQEQEEQEQEEEQELLWTTTSPS
jgi:hypothetical protein